MKSAKALGIAAYLALLIERISQAIQPRPRPTPAQIRRFEGVSQRLTLEVGYHAVKTPKGFVLIPKDRYFQEAEDVLEKL